MGSLFLEKGLNFKVSGQRQLQEAVFQRDPLSSTPTLGRDPSLGL